jgi:hypothetical protein
MIERLVKMHVIAWSVQAAIGLPAKIDATYNLGDW